MKLKRQAEDFLVEELPLVAGGDRGQFAFYRLSKTGLGTLEAIEAIARRWNLSGRQISYGGLKDKHAATIQYLTIFDGPSRPIDERNFLLEPVGRLPHAYGPAHFRGNRFEVTIRDLSADAAAKAGRAFERLPADGLPNYFDDQRFGSVGEGGAFIGAAWLRGDAEKALFLAIAEPNPADRPETRGEKAILRDTWGRWPEAKAKLERSHARSLVTYLVDHPADFRGAFARLRRELRSLYFSAYQSHLWNLILAGWLRSQTRPEQRIEVAFKLASLPIQRDLDPEQAAALAACKLPLPASRTPMPEGPIGELARDVVQAEGLIWDQLRVKHLKDVFFSKGERPAAFYAGALQSAGGPDELYPGRRKLRMTFELPKGAYATIVVKRVTEAA